jgi:hypothetical protein
MRGQATALANITPKQRGNSFDILYLTTHQASLSLGAYWMLGAGILGGVVAIPFGVKISWPSLRGHAQKAWGCGMAVAMQWYYAFLP